MIAFGMPVHMNKHFVVHVAAHLTPRRYSSGLS
jgi:hypothetical protein